MEKKQEWIQNRTNIGSCAILNNKSRDQRMPSVVEIKILKIQKGLWQKLRNKQKHLTYEKIRHISKQLQQVYRFSYLIHVIKY